MAALDKSIFSTTMAPVSVVVPCYCCTSTIRRALDSVAAQTLRPAEVILVDDCSPDDTLAQLYRLQESHPPGWIRVISLGKNSGPSLARNAGWDAATQPYLAFLDADDSWHPQKIEIQYHWMAAHPDVMLTGHQSVWLRQGNHFPDLPNTIQTRAISRIQLLTSNCLPTRSVMLKKEIACRFDPAKRYAEDYLLWLRILLSGHAVWWLKAPLAYSYKADFGGGGLSGELWEMEKGVLDAYRRVFQYRMISWLELAGLMLLSLVKFLRRVLVCQLRRLVARGLAG